MRSEHIDQDSLLIIGAVKAELARRDIAGVELVPVIGLNRNAVYARLRGEQAFTLTELFQIASHLGITLQDLFKSAELGRVQAEAA